MISYNELEKKYRNVVEFCLKNLELLENYETKIPYNLLNMVKETETTVDASPYFCIIKFYYDGFTAFKFEKTYDIIIVHKSSEQECNEVFSDTVISVHFNRNLLVEIEIYNADSSEIDWKNLLTGEITAMDSLN